MCKTKKFATGNVQWDSEKQQPEFFLFSPFPNCFIFQKSNPFQRQTHPNSLPTNAQVTKAYELYGALKDGPGTLRKPCLINIEP